LKVFDRKYGWINFYFVEKQSQLPIEQKYREIKTVRKLLKLFDRKSISGKQRKKTIMKAN
jgi:hypothetical protein